MPMSGAWQSGPTAISTPSARHRRTKKLASLDGTRLVDAVRLESARFVEALDGDVALDFEEFYSFQPESVRQAHSSATSREWFDAACAGKERLTPNDFFHWSLSKAAQSAGANALREAFKRWDTDNSGYLDAAEFAQAAEEMGYGAVGHQLFRKLDADNSGAISHDELAEALLESSPTPGAKELMTTLVWSATDAKPAGQPAPAPSARIDTSAWRLQSTDARGVLEEVRSVFPSSLALTLPIIPCRC